MLAMPSWDNSLLVMNACFPFDRDIRNLLLFVNTESSYWDGILVLVILGIRVIHRGPYTLVALFQFKQILTPLNFFLVDI